MKKHLLFSMLSIFTLSTCRETITSVSVNEQGRGHVAEITKPQELLKFEGFYARMQKVELQAQPEWTHSIKITPGDLWRYSDHGYLQVLSMVLTPIYKVDNVKQFNELLGIQQQANKVHLE